MYTRDQEEALYQLNEIAAQLDELSLQARDIMRANFPDKMPECDAYGVLNFGTSTNRYDTSLETVIESLENNEDDEEE